MSDSEEDEDLSRFKEAIDTSFLKLIEESKVEPKCEKTDNIHSARYLDVSTHYNDVRVSMEVQKRIGAKISAIIDKNFEYVEVEHKPKKYKVKGGVKLFKDSEGFLSCEETKDTFTEVHNKKSKELKKIYKRQNIDYEVEELNEVDKINAATVTGEFVLSKEQTKHWKSRRKDKVFKYKATGKSKNILIAI